MVETGIEWSIYALKIQNKILELFCQFLWQSLPLHVHQSFKRRGSNWKQMSSCHVSTVCEQTKKLKQDLMICFLSHYKASDKKFTNYYASPSINGLLEGFTHYFQEILPGNSSVICNFITKLLYSPKWIHLEVGWAKVNLFSFLYKFHFKA
jgi:hypothetical protein